MGLSQILRHNCDRIIPIIIRREMVEIWLVMIYDVLKASLVFFQIFYALLKFHNFLFLLNFHLRNLVVKGMQLVFEVIALFVSDILPFLFFLVYYLLLVSYALVKQLNEWFENSVVNKRPYEIPMLCVTF